VKDEIMKIVQTQQAPAAIGPYSQAVIANGIVYCSGQIALIPETGELLKGDISDQTHLVLENLSAVLNAAGSDLEHVIKATVFLKKMSDFPIVNAIYAEYFNRHKPARACVEVSCLPKNVDVEIDAIALLKQ
jgi:2-iminobutanoate/2-iminopropanoate deaminase